jgi:predicted dehydrogenase
MVMDGVDEATPEQITEWLRTSQWGRDAFQCGDNDQPDHLVAILRYMGGVTGTFTMTAFEEGRHIEIYGTKAKLRAGAFYKENGPGEITVTEHFSKKMRKVEIEEASGGYAGHGGGDWGLVSNLYNDMRVVEDTTLMTTPIQASAHSHVIAFAVEHARRTGEVVNIAEFERRVLAGELNY